MRKLLIVLIALTAIIVSTHATDLQPATIPDPPWTYVCGAGAEQECPNQDNTPDDTIAGHTAALLDSFSHNSRDRNISGYIIAARPYHSENEHISRYSFSISPSGETETFTEISGQSGSPRSSGTEDNCLSFLAGNATGIPPGLLNAIHSSKNVIYPPRGVVRSKDTVVREYPGIARVCIQTLVYWDDQESDRKNDHFSADSRVIIMPWTDPDNRIQVKNKAVRFSNILSRDPAGLFPQRDLHFFSVEPGGPATIESLEKPVGVAGSQPWYEYLGLQGLFGSSVTPGSDDKNSYYWHITTGFLSPYSDNPIGILLRSEFLTGQDDTRNAGRYSFVSTEFNGTRGWCSVSGWNCRESPQETSLFGSDFDLVWMGTDG
jgi:hypothetical protein